MAANTQNINAKKVLGYMALPGIVPLARELAGSGFGYIAFLFACVFQSVRILPEGHAYTRPDNIGKFTILQVLGSAAANIEFKRRNIDQIVVFGAVVAAIVLMFLQFVLLILAIFSGKAFAADQSLFTTPNPATDIAFLMLDYVFGIPGSGGGATGFFGSNALQSVNGSAAGPTPFHQGLQALFQFYNFAILLVAVIIFLYYVIVVVVETAQSGIPFGRRFSKIYAPMRLVFAIGLLVPLNYGFNAAQYITLYAAKLGSGFATNGWILYNNIVENPSGLANESLVATPTVPAIEELMYFSSVYHSCREIYKIWVPKNPANTKEHVEIDAYVIKAGTATLLSGYDYETAKKEFGRQDMDVVLGAPGEGNYAGGIAPYCGKLTIALSNENPAVYQNGGGSTGSGGVRAVEKFYFDLVKELFKKDTDSSNSFQAFGERAAHGIVPGVVKSVDGNSPYDPCFRSGDLKDAATCSIVINGWQPPSSIFEEKMKNVRTDLRTNINSALADYKKALQLKISDEIKQRGWGGAGIWFNNIADINGAFTGAVYAVPSVSAFPGMMEYVKKAKQTADKTVGMCEMFDPSLGGNKQVNLNATDEPVAVTMNETYKYFICERPTQANGTATPSGSVTTNGPCGTDSVTEGSSAKGLSANTFLNAINLVFGLNGLTDVRCSSVRDAATGLPKTSPLAQLSIVGKGLVENSIRSMGAAIGSSLFGGMFAALNQQLGAAMKSASSMFVGIATIGLSAGFVLYYILPFLPFIYFFFAVGSWVKSIFEAMVGVPLWALAHLKIDGEGFSGRAAAGGYFLILEIFLRPIVTVFGLIAAFAIFGAMAATLNELFDLVVMNIAGDTADTSGGAVDVSNIESFRVGVVDKFFFTIMYTILLYLMATSSFKLINAIPAGFMRWIGSGVSVFNDDRTDPTQHLTQYAAISGAQVTSRVLGGVNEGASAVGGGLGGLMRGFSGQGQQGRGQGRK